MKRILLISFLLTFFYGSIAQEDVVETLIGIPESAGNPVENALGTASKINGAWNIAIDSENNIYFSSVVLNKIFKYDNETEKVSTFAGTGSIEFSSDTLLATQTNIESPIGICFDKDDNLYFTQGRSHCAIRVIKKADNKIYTLIGDGRCQYSGDKEKGPRVSLGFPYGIAIDQSNNLYWTEAGSDVIRKWRDIDSVVVKIAGSANSERSATTGIDALKDTISIKGGIAVSPSGDSIFYSSAVAHNVNLIYPEENINKIKTVAGTGSVGNSVGEEGLGTNISLNSPDGIAFGPDGGLYFCEENTGLIRMLDLEQEQLRTVAGVYQEREYNDNFLDPFSTHIGPKGLTFGNDDELYFTDAKNALIRKIRPCKNPEIISTLLSTDDFCAEDSVLIKVDGVLFDAEEWLWAEGCDDLAIVIASGAMINVAIGEIAKTYYVKAKGLCEDSDVCESVTIKNSCLDVYNAFSPNGDGINEYFHIELVYDHPDNQLTIYNRYGDVIEYFEDYDNEKVRWEGGTLEDEEDIVPGTYYFVLYNDLTKVSVTSGWVQVFK